MVVQLRLEHLMHKVCFHFTDFDRDVSSGTSHSVHQWHELFMAFGVTEVAVINETTESYPKVSEQVEVTEYSSLEDFISKNDNLVFVEQGASTHYKNYDYPKDCWLVFGAEKTLPKADIMIPTKGGNSLYSREAVAIILSDILL